MESAVSPATKEVLVRTFYRFRSVAPERVEELTHRLLSFGEENGLRGSILLSVEGCNGTVAGTPQAVAQLFAILGAEFPGLGGQDSWSEDLPFARWKVLKKTQIVAAREPELSPRGNHQGQLTPQEWDEVRALARQGKVQMVDVRNHYEVAIGTFPEATDPNTTTFKEFSDYLDREVGQSLDPSVPTAIFCTGGIRCEKARLDLERRGFGEVLQLHGGILNYMAQKPEQGFQGECFVFDERVALDQTLEPTRIYDRCPGCGDPWPKDSPPHQCREKRPPQKEQGSRSID